MKRLFLALLFVNISLFASAQNEPSLEYVMQLNVTLGEAFSGGRTTFGTRTVIPITGGTFSGPDIKGTIIPGGADWQLTDDATGRTQLEAIYAIRTDDGINIHVRNVGIISNGKDRNGKDSFYFRAAPKFEAPNDSKYAWLNNALFVCSPDFTGPQGTITLHVWMVK